MLKNLLPQVEAEQSPDSLRGLKGEAATAYFAVLDDMILRDKRHF